MHYDVFNGDDILCYMFDGGGTYEAWVYPRSVGEGGYGRIFDKGPLLSSVNIYS